jgi:hypothetical protein
MVFNDEAWDDDDVPNPGPIKPLVKSSLDGRVCGGGCGAKIDMQWLLWMDGFIKRVAGVFNRKNKQN